MPSPGVPNELRWAPSSRPVETLEKHQKEQIFVFTTCIIRMSVGPLKRRYGQSYKPERDATEALHVVKQASERESEQDRCAARGKKILNPDPETPNPTLSALFSSL